MVMTNILKKFKKNSEIQEILTTERDKRNELSTKYNRGVNIIGVIYSCLGVTAIGLGITGVGLLSTIIAAPAVVAIEVILIGLLRVVGNQAIKKLSLKIEKHEKIAFQHLTPLTLSVMSFRKHYHMIPFQMKNIHQFYWSLKRSHERKKILEKNLK